MYTTTDSEAQQMLLCIYAILAGNSILIYDHMVTLPEEVAFIWCRPKALSAMLFLVNRYVALLGNICALVMDFLPISDELAGSQRISVELFEIYASQTTAPVVSRNHGLPKRLLACMIIIMVALGGGASAGTFGHFSSNATILPGVGCYETYTAQMICKTRGLLRSSLATRRYIIDIIFHDGAMYFGAMVLCNIPNILTYYINQSGSAATAGMLSTFTSCMSVTLISRLMLNLHKSVGVGVFSTSTWDDDNTLPVLTTRVNVQLAISSHHVPTENHTWSSLLIPSWGGFVVSRVAEASAVAHAGRVG
ncbi:hypothetical protein DFH29DRAFT_875356 [Suillus ampliporus]|nr:hypothetical protein DFH29DRAFT_875356 [Suillus ampliporus]